MRIEACIGYRTGARSPPQAENFDILGVRGTGVRKEFLGVRSPPQAIFYILGVRDKGTKGTRGIYDSPPHVSRRRSVGDRFTKLKRVTSQLRNINMKL